MKEQTTCSASYLHISLMFIRFTEKFFFVLFSSFFCKCVVIPILPRPDCEMPDYHNKT